jgi:hypothetical protein
MGKTARLCAARIKRIDRAEFWPFVKNYFNGSARLAGGIRGAYYLEASREVSQFFIPNPMFPILLALVWKVFLPALLMVALVDVLTQTQPQRIRRLHRGGLSQRSIASRLGVSRYAVRLALA